MSLATLGQEDFAVGTLRGIAPDQQPGVGVWSALNGVFNDDGDIYRRGGSRYADPGFSLTQPMTWAWSGYLNDFFQILTADSAGIYDASGVLVAGSTGLPRPVQAAVIGDTIYLSGGQSVKKIPSEPLAGAAWTSPWGTQHVATIAGRLVVGSDNIVGFSEPDDPTNFVADNFHKLPGGVSVRGLAAVRDTLLVFTNYGLWAITNMAYNLTDAAGNIQQTLSLIVPELSLLHEAGLAPWSGRFVAACADRVYLVDPVSPPVPISDSITPLYMDLIRAGCRPGLAKVYRNTLFLPMLLRNPDTLEDEVYTLLTCRLNRPIQGRYVYYPWAELTGHAARVRALDIATQNPFTVSPTVKPDSWLFGAGEDGHLIDLTDLMNPDASNALDADGSSIPFEVETRDFPTGQGQPNHLKRIRLRYTLEGAAQIGVEITDDRTRTLWVALGQQDLTAPGRDPASWWLPVPARMRFVRARFTLTGAPARFVMHQFDLTVRPAAHAR